MSIDAMKQALEALEHEAQKGNDDAYRVERDALRAAIEQAQEPVAWISESENLLSWDKFYDHMTPLYTVPRQWQGLTNEEIHECWPGLHVMDVSGQFYRNIEAKLRERNT